MTNSQPTPNPVPIRSSDLEVTVALVQQWTDEIYGGPGAVASSDDICLATLAAQWGADQELEACCALLEQKGVPAWSLLRLHRRPKPPSLKEQALKALEDDDIDVYLIRRALEALPND
jgi:hypothetical protein